MNWHSLRERISILYGRIRLHDFSSPTKFKKEKKKKKIYEEQNSLDAQPSQLKDSQVCYLQSSRFTNKPFEGFQLQACSMHIIEVDVAVFRAITAVLH